MNTVSVDMAAGSDEQGFARTRVPFARRSHARVEVGGPFGDQAEFDRRSELSMLGDAVCRCDRAVRTR